MPSDSSIGCWIPCGAMVKMYSSGPVMTGLNRVYLIKAAMVLFLRDPKLLRTRQQRSEW